MEHIQQEEKFISLLLQEKKFASDWLQSGVGIDRFDRVHQNILTSVVYAINNNVKLSRDTFKNFLVNYVRLTPAETAAQISLYNRCLGWATKHDDFPMLLENIKRSYIRRKTSEHLQHYTRDREKMGDIGANHALIEKLQTLEADSVETKAAFQGVHEYKDEFMEQLQYRRDNPHVRLICGIKEIDQTMNVGFKDGHLSIFCAPIGGGKTTLMCNIAANLYARYNTNILYIPLEMPRSEIFTKLVARENKLSLTKIEHPDMMPIPEYEAMKKTLSEGFDKWLALEHKFQVLDMPERAKVSTIRREIEKRISYFKPKVVFIDYADNLVPDLRRSRSDEEMNDMLQDLRKMGKALGFHTCSAAQLAKEFIKSFNESKEGKQSSADSTSIRGGLVYSMNADSMYAQMRDPAQPNEKLILMCPKSRHGSPVFAQGNTKTHLSFFPDMALIESPQDMVYQNPNKDSELLAMLDKQPTQEEIDNLNEESPF